MRSVCVFVYVTMPGTVKNNRDEDDFANYNFLLQGDGEPDCAGEVRMGSTNH